MQGQEGEMKSQLLVWDNMESQITLNLTELPVDVVVEILKRVPTKSVCRIRCVSKKLLSIIDSPSFFTLHSTFLFDHDSHLPPHPPQLILHYRRSLWRCVFNRINVLSTLRSLHHDPSNAQGAAQRKPRPILQSSTFYTLEFVFCNLFCIMAKRDHRHSFLINPFRGEVLRLPPGHNIAKQVCGPNSEATHCSTFGMGFDSVTNTYKILRVTEIHFPNFRQEKSRCVSHVLVLGTSEWRQLTSVPPPGLIEARNICAHGDMHWLLREEGQYHIVSFDLKKEEFFRIPYHYIPDVACSLELIKFRGSMAIVETTSGTKIEIWVMKDYLRKQWMLDYSINMFELDPQVKFMRAVCCEWEHGLVFLNEMGTTTLSLDLRGPVVTKKLLRYPNKGNTATAQIMMSLYGSLISLKRYANLEGGEEPVTCRHWSEEVAKRKNFFYLKRR